MRNETVNMVEEENIELTPQYKGIGGWLILIIIGYIFSIVRTIVYLNQVSTLFTNGTIELLSNPNSSNYIPSYSILIWYEIIGNLLILIAIIISFVLMFMKKRIYKIYAICLIIVSYLFVVSDLIIVRSLGIKVYAGNSSQFITGLISSSIWITYFVQSERVKNTFVN